MSGEKKKVLILSVSAGAGHIRAAEALRTTAEKSFKNIEVIHLDLMDMVPKLFKKLYAESYIDLVNKQPALWGYLYQKMDTVNHDSKMKKFRLAIEKLNTRKLGKALTDIQPEHIICTHFLPAELLSRLIRKGKFDGKCWVQVTDFDVHSLWIHEHMSGYFAASEEVAWRMADRGISKETIHVTGIPIMPVFSKSYSRKICAEKLGIDPGKTTILMMSGGEGVGQIDILAERLLKLDGDYQLIALSGKNEDLLAKLQKLAKTYPEQLKPVGFTKTIEELMAASDFAISKPGGLTTSECLAMGLPMIVVSPIPGQEERNSDYLLENGAGMKAHDAAGLEYRVSELLKDDKRLKAMKSNTQRIATPKAASNVLKIVLEVLNNGT